jgi:hypothetical protein
MERQDMILLNPKQHNRNYPDEASKALMQKTIAGEYLLRAGKLVILLASIAPLLRPRGRPSLLSDAESLPSVGISKIRQIQPQGDASIHGILYQGDQ